MDKNKLIKQISSNIDTLTEEEIKKVINDLTNKVSYETLKSLNCMILDASNKLSDNEKDLIKQKEKIINDYKTKVIDGDAYMITYTYETGTYSYFDEDTDIVYYPSDELDDILINAYNYIKDATMHKKYTDALEIFELVLYTVYQCEEKGNPEYDDSDKTYDYYECNIYDAKNNLAFSFDILILYAVYALVMSNHTKKYEKTYEYMKHGKINLMDLEKIGIEKINSKKYIEELNKYNEKRKNK